MQPNQQNKNPSTQPNVPVGSVPLNGVVPADNLPLTNTFISNGGGKLNQTPLSTTANQNSQSITPEKPPKKTIINKWVIILTVTVILIIGVAATFFALHNRHKISATSNKSTVSSVSVTAQSSNDLKSEKDLAQITNSLDSSWQTDSTAQLPNSLSQLNLKGLNYPIRNYSYKVIAQPMGGPNEYSYQVCANFDTDTFTANAYSNYNGSQTGVEDNNGHTPPQFAIHSNGQQCYEIDETDPNNGPEVSIVLSKSESNLVGSNTNGSNTSGSSTN